MVYEYYMLANCFVGCVPLAEYLTCTLLGNAEWYGCGQTDWPLSTLTARQYCWTCIDITFRLEPEQQSTSTTCVSKTRHESGRAVGIRTSIPSENLLT
jgi:hypothetical protein